MRASLTTAVLVSTLLLVPFARAAQPAKAAPAPQPAEVTPEEPAPSDILPDGADDEDDEDADATDAPGIQEDVNAGQKELEELHKAESKAIDESATLPRHFGRLGLANPLRTRINDTGERGGEIYEVPPLAPEGDAGSLLAELNGLDLAALKAEYDIPVEINADVIQYIRFFQGPGRKWYVHWLARSKRWIPIMRPILAEEGVPLDLVYLAMIESGFSPYAFSWAHASGFWQFMSPTGRRFGLRDDFWVDERRDPILSTHAAARYLKALHDEFGDWYLAWASYNAGEGKLRKAVRLYNTHDFWEISHSGRFLRKETKYYVPKLIAAALIAKHPERFGFTEADIQAEGPFAYDEVEVPDATELSSVAQSAGVSIDDVQQLNPSLRRWCTPPARNGVGYKIKLPVGKKDVFAASLEKQAQSERQTFRYHRVSRGESLTVLARKFNTATDAILRMNGIANARALRPGMDLIIPMPLEVAMHIADAGASWSEPRAHRGRHGRHSRWARAAARESVYGAPRSAAKASAKKAPAHVAAGKRYVIHSGDTLWSIAHKFGVTVAALQRWNGFSRNPRLQAGHSILVGPPARKAERTASVRKGRG